MTEQENPVAIKGMAHTHRLMANGVIRMQVDIDPEWNVDVAKFFGIGLPVFLVRADEGKDREQLITKNARQLIVGVAQGGGYNHEKEEYGDTVELTSTLIDKKRGIYKVEAELDGSGNIKRASLYGQQAKELKQSGFFRRPDVWAGIGTDKEFLEWVRLNHCASITRDCQGDVVAAHVRRVSDGAGTGIKPNYAAIPLCYKHHTEQHAHGESALGGREWFDQQRINYVEKWAWETLKTTLGHDSWRNVPPAVLTGWTIKRDLLKYLPEAYK